MGVENITVHVGIYYTVASVLPWSNYISSYRTLSITLVITVSADSPAVELYFIVVFFFILLRTAHLRIVKISSTAIHKICIQNYISIDDATGRNQLFATL